MDRRVGISHPFRHPVDVARHPPSGPDIRPRVPWWLIRQNRIEDALNSLRRLSKPHPSINLQDTLAMMVKTNILEAQLEVGTTYSDCWKGVNLRRIEICIMLFVIQNFSGNPVGFATYLFEQTGLNSKQSFDMGVGLNGVGFVGTLTSAIPLIYFGISSIVSILFIVALLCFAHDYGTNDAYRWIQATLLIILSFI